MPTQANTNNLLLIKILELLEEQKKEIEILKAYIKQKVPEPEPISTGWFS